MNYRKAIAGRNSKKKRKRQTWERTVYRRNSAYDKIHGGPTVIVLSTEIKPKQLTSKDRLALLGFEGYAEYLRSSHWKGFKDRYRKSGLPKFCIVCNKYRVQLHHISYSRLGNEQLTDVIPLCQGHHSQVHDAAKKRGIPISHTWSIMAKLHGWTPTQTEMRMKPFVEFKQSTFNWSD